MTQAERIKNRRKLLGLTQQEVADFCKVERNSVTNWEKNPNVEIEGKNLLRLAFSLKCKPTYITEGKPEPDEDAGDVSAHHPDDPLPEDVVLIKESEVTFQGGNGNDLQYEIIADSEPATYRLSWFQKERLSAKHCRRFKCSGESNEPFVFSGDTILVNMQETQIKNGKVYAFWHEGEGRRMKKLFQKNDGTLTLRSFNSDFPDEVLSPTESAEKITIIGRVRDKSGKGGL